MADPILQVSKLHYAYADGTRALRGVDLVVHRGERVGLVGPNGSGKSTLLMCINGLLIGEGMIHVDGIELSKSRIKEIRGRVGLIFQNPDDQLFMPTLSDDLAFGPINLGLPDTEVQERVNEAAAQMQLVDQLDRAPYHLSMGQKHNAAIAAILAMKPAILLMDEPSSNLDPRSRRKLIEILTPLDATMLIASHDLALIGRLCGRVSVIDEGRIVADGRVDDILGDESLMDAHGLEVWRDHTRF